MTANPRFLYDDFGQGCTITASSEASSEFAASNAVVDFRGVPWRSGTVAVANWLQFTAAVAFLPLGIALVDHNVSAAATILRLRSSTTSTFSGGTQTVVGPSILTWRSGIIFAFWAAGALSARLYWRLEITDTTNPDGYIQIGRVLLGLPFEPARSYRQGWDRDADDKSNRFESMNVVRTDIVKPQPEGMSNLEFRIPNPTDLNSWKAFRRKVQTARRFVFVPHGTNLDGSDSASPPLDDALWGTFEGKVSLPGVFNRNSRAVCAVKECI